MKILVTGTRDLLDDLQIAYVRDHLLEAISEEGPLPDGKHVFIHGAAKGVDAVADDAGNMWDDCEVRRYPADWGTFGKRAGPIRNQRMLDEEGLDLVMAFPAPDSRGTWDMVERAVKARIPVRVYPL